MCKSSNVPPRAVKLLCINSILPSKHEQWHLNLGPRKRPFSRFERLTT